MTWSKFGTEFRDECGEAALSDAAFRTHVEAVMYLYGVESMELRVQRRQIRKWAGSDDFEAAIVELVRVGFWEADGDGWRVIHHAGVFRASLGYQLRERERSKEAKRRPPRAGTREGTRAGTREVTREGTRAGTREGTREGTRPQTVSQTDIQTAGTYSDGDGDGRSRAHRAVERIDSTTGEILEDDPWRLCRVCRNPIPEALWADGERTHATCDSLFTSRPTDPRGQGADPLVSGKPSAAAW